MLGLRSQQTSEKLLMITVRLAGDWDCGGGQRARSKARPGAGHGYGAEYLHRASGI